MGVGLPVVKLLQSIAGLVFSVTSLLSGKDDDMIGASEIRNNNAHCK